MQRPIEKPVGTPVQALDTPALLVDIDCFAESIAAIRQTVRAEVWVHKTPALARLQTNAANVVGIAVRSLAEAEVFAAAGFEDIRVLRPVLDPAAPRVAALAESIRLVLADDGVPLWGTKALDGAVTVSACVTSVPEPGRAILDCGQKAIGRDFGNPRLVGNEAVRVSAGSAEHGVVAYPPDQTPFAIGDWAELRPADIPTVFSLHDFAYAIRDRVLDAAWPISARGAF